MRKINVDSVKEDFCDFLEEVSEFHWSIANEIEGQQQLSTLNELSFLRVAVGLEGFFSDIFTGYINRDCAVFINAIEEDFEAELSTAKSKAILEQLITFSKPAHLTREQAIALTDSQGRNITFATADALVRKAHRWLSPRHAVRFNNLDAQDLAIIDLTSAIRNHLAHRSQASLDKMNECLRLGPLYPTGLQRADRGIYNIGSYLKTFQGDDTRLDIIIDRLDGISNKV